VITQRFPLLAVKPTWRFMSHAPALAVQLAGHDYLKAHGIKLIPASTLP
jgi:hypothetical protein